MRPRWVANGHNQPEGLWCVHCHKGQEQFPFGGEREGGGGVLLLHTNGQGTECIRDSRGTPEVQGGLPVHHVSTDCNE